MLFGKRAVKRCGPVPGVCLVLLWRLVLVAGFPPDIFSRHFESLHEGDVNLGAVVSVHTNNRGRCAKDTTMSLSAVEFLEAMLFAVHQVNEDQVIPGVTLGIYVLDDCFSASLSIMRALQFMPRAAPPPSQHTTASERLVNHAHSNDPAQSDSNAHSANPVHSSPHDDTDDHSQAGDNTHPATQASVLDKLTKSSSTKSGPFLSWKSGIHSKDSFKDSVPLSEEFNATICDRNKTLSDSPGKRNKSTALTDKNRKARSVITKNVKPDSTDTNIETYPSNSSKPEALLSTSSPAKLRHFSHLLVSNPSTINKSAIISTVSSPQHPFGKFPTGLSRQSSVLPDNVTFSTRPPFVKNTRETEGWNSSPIQVADETKGWRSPIAAGNQTMPKRTTALPPFFEVVGVIGAFTSQHTIEVAKVLQLFELPQISPSATSDVLSDKQRFPYFLRTLPPDRDQVKAMGQLVRHFNWTYVSVVYSDDPYGHGSYGRLTDTLHSLNVCVAKTLTLTSDMMSVDYDGIITSLQRHLPARVVLLYADVKHIRPLMEAMGRSGAERDFIWVGSDSLFSELQHNPHLCEVNLGSIAVKAHSINPPAFLDHMMSKIQQRRQATFHDDLDSWEMPPDLLRMSDTYMPAFSHPSAFARTPSVHPGGARLSKVHPGGTQLADSHPPNTRVADIHPRDARLTDVHPASSKTSSNSSKAGLRNDDANYHLHMFGIAAFVIDSVYAFAYAIRALLKEHCPEARGRQARECVRRHQLHPYLQRVQFNGTSGAFEFDDNGDAVGAIEVQQCQQREGRGGRARTRPIGVWGHRHDTLSIHKARFFPNNHSVPSSVCAEPCGKGQIYSFMRQTCCWTCVTCKVNEVTTANASGCVPCPPFQWPDQGSRSHCQDIAVPPTTTHSVVALALQVATVVGLMMTLVTAFTFCLYRSQRVIRSSSRELSGVMLGGLTASYILVFPLLATPSTSTCYVTHVGFGLTFTLVYAPLLVKTHRIFRIFRAGRQSAALPKCTSPASQLGITTFLVFVQVVIVTISTAVDPPSAHLHQPVMTEPRVVRLCHLPVSGLATSLTYHLLLVLLCTLLAFKTRRLPDNYNESRYIAFCVDTTLLVWITFVPAYFTATVGAHQVVVLALTHLINSCVQLACLFLPRLYALYRQTKKPAGAGSDMGSKLGSYGLIPIKGEARRLGMGNGPVENNSKGVADGGGGGVKPDGFMGGSNGRVSVSDVMGSNTLSLAESSVVMWECKDEEEDTITAAV